MARTITDPLELDALPPWAVVEDVLGVAWVRHPGTPDRADHWVSYYGDRMSAQYVAAEGPLTVLHDPSVSLVAARCSWADCPHGERCAHAQGSGAVSDAVVEVYPFHARIDGMPDLFHVTCSQHPEFGFCGSEAEAAQARAEHLSTHEGSAASTHICTTHCEQGRGHYKVMTPAPVVPAVSDAVVEVAARALRIEEVGDSATPGFAARQWDNGSADRDKPMRLARAALEAALPHLVRDALLAAGLTITLKESSHD